MDESYILCYAPQCHQHITHWLSLIQQVEAVVAIDLKYFIMLKRHAELARATYLTAFDLLEKNMEILEKPRGSKGESSHLSMF